MGAGHDHGSSETVTGRAALLTGGFMLVEAVGGVLAGSLALLADAAHMATDAAALALAWYAFRAARRPSDLRRTYGYGRLQVLAAFANGVTLVLLTLWVGVEAVGRLAEPVEVLGGLMLAIALTGLAVNLLAFWMLRQGDRQNLNIRGALLHVLGDLLGSVAALVAALVILLTGWTPIDPILSLGVCLLLLRSAWHLVSESGHVLLEGAPADLDVDEVAADLATSVPGAEDVHHVHAWSLNDRSPMLTLHVRAGEGIDADALLTQVLDRLRTAFGVAHATVQIEHGDCPEDRASR